MSNRKLERTIKRQLTQAVAKSVKNSKQYLVCYVTQDGAMANAIMFAGRLTAVEVDRMEHGLRERNKQAVIIFNITQLETEEIQDETLIPLPTLVRQAIEQLILDSDKGTVPAPGIRRDIVQWLADIGHPLKEGQ